MMHIFLDEVWHAFSEDNNVSDVYCEYTCKVLRRFYKGYFGNVLMVPNYNTKKQKQIRTDRKKGTGTWWRRVGRALHRGQNMLLHLVTQWGPKDFFPWAYMLVNREWSCISIALFPFTAHSKGFTTPATFTHSYTDGGCCHARRQLLIRSNLGFSILLKDTSACRWGENGIRTRDRPITRRPALPAELHTGKILIFDAHNPHKMTPFTIRSWIIQSDNICEVQKSLTMKSFYPQSSRVSTSGNFIPRKQNFFLQLSSFNRNEPRLRHWILNSTNRFIGRMRQAPL